MWRLVTFAGPELLWRGYSLSPKLMLHICCLLFAASGYAQAPGDHDRAYGDRVSANFDNPRTGTLVSEGWARAGTELFNMNATTAAGNAAALQADGKMVIAGSCQSRVAPYGTNFCLARLDVDGTPDITFDGPGADGSGTGTANGAFEVVFPGYDSEARSVAIQVDQKIVLAGYCNGLGAYFVCMARLNADGSYDAGFGAGLAERAGSGRLRFSLDGGNESLAKAVTVQDDGKIVVAGECVDAQSGRMCIARLKVDGSFDETFRGPGADGSGVGNGHGRFRFTVRGAADERSEAIAQQADGKLVIAGLCYAVGGKSDFCVSRLNPDGSFDTVFDGPSASGSGAGSANGRFTVSVNEFNNEASAVLIQPDRRIVIAGSCVHVSAPRRWCLVRLNENGVLDWTFNGPGSNDTGVGLGGGRIVLPMAGSPYLSFTPTLVAQPDGRMLMAGPCQTGSSVCVVRLNTNGTLDTAFTRTGTTALGYLEFPFGAAPSRFSRLLVQSDGRVIGAGSCASSGGAPTLLCATRLLGGPLGARQCTMDIDGDGRTSAATDGLLMARAMLGFRGAGLTHGIAFAPHAQRKTSEQIREFLSLQCGLELAP